MSFTVRGKLDGAAEIVRRLDAVNKAVKTKILAKAVGKVARIVRKAARQNAPVRAVVYGNIVDLRLLKKSIAVKMVRYRNGNVVAVIGPQEGMKQIIGEVKRGPNKGKPIYEDPANIGHLVELGHGGPHAAIAHPFMRTAFESTKTDVADVFAAEVAAGINEALSGVA